MNVKAAVVFQCPTALSGLNAASFSAWTGADSMRGVLLLDHGALRADDEIEIPLCKVVCVYGDLPPNPYI